MFREILEHILNRQRSARMLPLLDQKFVRQGLRCGTLHIVPPETSHDLASFLRTLPHSGSELDSNRIACERMQLNLSGYAVETMDWFLAHPIGKDPLVLLYFGPEDPCLAATPQFAIRNIHQFPYKGSFRRPFFGGAFNGQRIVPRSWHFGEFNGDRSIWLAV